MGIIGSIIDKIGLGYGSKKIEDIDIPVSSAPPDLSHLGAPQFATEYFQAQQYMLEADSIPLLLKAINDSRLTASSKRAFTTYVNSYMVDRTTILANLTAKNEAEIAFIRSIIDRMASIITSSKKSDRAKPEFVLFAKNIESLIWLRLTRTMGAEDRERILDAVLSVRYQSSQKMSPETVNQYRR